MDIYQEEQSHFESEGKLYDLNPLFQLAHNLPAIDFDLTALKWGLRTDLDAEDEYRIQKADLNIPILITYDPQWGYILIDGEHRTQRAIREGKQSLPAKFLTAEQLETARI